MFFFNSRLAIPSHFLLQKEQNLEECEEKAFGFIEIFIGVARSRRLFWMRLFAQIVNKRVDNERGRRRRVQHEAQLQPETLGITA